MTDTESIARERAAFEKWATTDPEARSIYRPDANPLSRDKSGVYWNYQVSAMWIAWQGRAEAAKSAADPALLQRLYNHRGMMAHHQKERNTGKLLLECITEIERLNSAKSDQP